MRPNNDLDLEQQLKLLGNALRARPRLTDRVMKKLAPIAGEVFEPVSLGSATERVGSVKSRRSQTKSGSGLRWRWLVVTAAGAGLLMLLYLLSLAVRHRDDSPPKPPTPREAGKQIDRVRSGPAPG